MRRVSPESSFGALELHDAGSDGDDLGEVGVRLLKTRALDVGVGRVEDDAVADVALEELGVTVSAVPAQFPQLRCPVRVGDARLLPRRPEL